MLTDDNLITLIHDTYTGAVATVTAPVNLTATVRRQHLHHRRCVAGTIAVPVAAAAALAVIQPGTHHAASRSQADPRHSDSPSAIADPAQIRLAGDTFTLPSSFHASTGTCTISLPDGTTQEGTPGAEGACVAIWQSDQPPSWTTGHVVTEDQSGLQRSEDPDAYVVQIWEGTPGQISVTLTEFDQDGHPHYIVGSADVPDPDAIVPDQIVAMLKLGAHLR